MLPIHAKADSRDAEAVVTKAEVDGIEWHEADGESREVGGKEHPEIKKIFQLCFLL